MLITSLDYSTYTGRIAVGRVHRGTLREGMAITIAHRDGTKERTKIKELHTFTGMGHQKTDAVSSGDICAIIGLPAFEIGDTICDAEEPEALPTISIDEPTMSMLFTINDSPFFGKEGRWCTSRHIHERLQRELALSYGVIPVYQKEQISREELFRAAVRMLRQKGYLTDGDKIACLSGREGDSKSLEINDVSEVLQ
jgi:predicted membrane GTPase involved in stress response